MLTTTHKRSQGILWGIGLSFLVHVFVMLYRIQDSLTTAPQPKEDFIELAQLPQTLPTDEEVQLRPQPSAKPKEKQMAATEDAGNRAIDPNAAFLSEHNQTAQAQTRAETVDDFRKKTGTGIKAKTEGPAFASAATGENGKETSLSEDGVTLAPTETAKTKAGVKKNWKSLSFQDLSVNGDGGALSASDDYMPHVASGDRTILSTREFKFYSYYNRVKDLLRQHWKPKIEREVAKMWSKGRMQEEEELKTRVLVLLDEKGKVQKISKTGTCGFEEIDEAAVQAFTLASPFPNPPKALVEADGFVRINWDFILQTQAAPRIQFNAGGGNRY